MPMAARGERRRIHAGQICPSNRAITYPFDAIKRLIYNDK